MIAAVLVNENSAFVPVLRLFPTTMKYAQFFVVFIHLLGVIYLIAYSTVSPPYRVHGVPV